MSIDKRTILVSGMLAGVPDQGGASWAVLQYVLGFRHLGHEVIFVEEIERAALQPAGAPLVASANAAYFRQLVADFDLAEQAALVLAGTNQTIGLPYERLIAAAERADLLLNIAGTLTDERLFGLVPCRVYLDLDPAFTQLWHDVQGIDMRFADHTHFVTIGQAIGQDGCRVPTCGCSWIKTLQPVVLERWPVAEDAEVNGISTVANWRAYGSIEHQGVFYGQKAHSLRKLIALPTLTDDPFVLALSIHPGDDRDLACLTENRWRIVDPLAVAGTPAAYADFIRSSRAEFGVAKSGYVAARCGWFSDRSICYLASGRPVIAQETGFSDYLPTGEGLFAFETVDDVLASLEALKADYQRHRRAARDIAEVYFDSDRVLGRLLDLVGVGR